MHYFLFGLSAVLLTSCMVGPHFHPPRLSMPPHPLLSAPHQAISTIRPSPASNNGHPSHSAPSFSLAYPICDHWWTAFHSPALNHFICLGLANNPNMAAAKAVLLQAEASLEQQTGSTLFPTITGTFSGTRNHTAPALNDSAHSPTRFNLYNATLNVTYTLDWFGKLRRQLELLGAQVESKNFELEATFTMLVTNIITTAITASSLQEQIRLTLALIAAQTKQWMITQKSVRAGGRSQIELLLQQVQLNKARAILPGLQQNLSTQLHALSVLTGQFPESMHTQLPPCLLKQLVLPQSLPISLSSMLVQQRPDIRAAEALLHAASAQIGITTANLYPSITLSANTAWNNSTLNALFSPARQSWAIGPLALSLPIFQGGALLAMRKAAIAAYQQAAANYQQTVLHAFQNVVDVLRAIQADQVSLHLQEQQAYATKKAFLITQKQYAIGGTSYLTFLVAEQNNQQARLNLIKAKTEYWIHIITLFQALGGGWWHRTPLAFDPILLNNVSQYVPQTFNLNPIKNNAAHTGPI